MRLSLAWIALCLGLAACSDDDRPPPLADGSVLPVDETPCEELTGDALSTCLTAHYFQGYAPRTSPSCAGFTPSAQKIGGRREVSLFRAPAIRDAALVTQGQLLQRFYADYDLTFFTTGPAQAVSFSYALDATNAQLEAAVAQAGVPAGQEPTPEQTEQINQLVAAVLYQQLREFIVSQSNPPLARVNVVVLPQIASPDVASQIKGVLGGLGLSPRLLRDLVASDPQRDLFALMSLPDDFTPTLFVGHDDIVRLAGNVEGVVAHEMGHALGLQHTTESGDVMTQGQSIKSCAAGLTDEQVEQLRSSAEALSTAEPTWQALRDLHHATVARALALHRARP